LGVTGTEQALIIRDDVDQIADPHNCNFGSGYLHSSWGAHDRRRDLLEQSCSQWFWVGLRLCRGSDAGFVPLDAVS
jgi:hypothetical protein